jgi:hypothetical protein
MISYFVEMRADGDITPNRQIRQGCAINYKFRGIKSEIYKVNSDNTLEFICGVPGRMTKKKKRLPGKKSDFSI